LDVFSLLLQVNPNARHARLLRKLTGSESEQNISNAEPSRLRKKVLHSKSTIDIPDHPRDRGADSDAENGQYRALPRKSKVQSAPAMMPRTKVLPPARKGPLDSAGRVITLEGLTKVSNRKQLSPLKPLPEQSGRRKRTEEANTSQAPSKGGIYRQRAAQGNANRKAVAVEEEEDNDGGDSASEKSPVALTLAQIEQQRAYNQQHDPLWQAQQAQQAQLAQQALLAQQAQQQMQVQQLQMQMQQQLQSLNMAFQQPFATQTGASGLIPQFPGSGAAAATMPFDAHQQMLLQRQLQQQMQHQQMQQALAMQGLGMSQQAFLTPQQQQQQQFEMFQLQQAQMQQQQAQQQMQMQMQMQTQQNISAFAANLQPRADSPRRHLSGSSSPGSNDYREAAQHEGGNGEADDQEEGNGDVEGDDEDERDDEEGSDDGEGEDGNARGDAVTPPPAQTPPARELDREEQMVEEMVNMDIETALARLQKFQQSSGASVKAGTDVKGGVLGYAKPGATATLTKHAKSLSGHLHAAEQHLAEYRNLAGGNVYGAGGIL
jgi:hypothetical protein